MRQRDPEFDDHQLLQRVKLTFQTIQTAWSNLTWDDARPFLSDSLFEAQSYWINAYRAAGLRNVTLGSRVEAIELARLLSDRWYDALTVRIHARGPDYTVRDADGAVVGGSKTKVRAYTEYWTLIRSSARTGATHTAATCPACGAPLEVNMAAVCSHCEAKVNSGEFDWVLSRIEPDEVYGGSQLATLASTVVPAIFRP